MITVSLKQTMTYQRWCTMDDFLIDLHVGQDKCIGCGACKKVCPVDAITMDDIGANKDKANIHLDKCISCGRCAVVCPVKTIKFPSYVDYVQHLIDSNENICLMIAPSFIVQYENEIHNLLMQWRRAGFNKITEVTYGARLVTHKYMDIISADKSRKYITSTCPVVFDYIVKYEKENLPDVMNVISPMIAISKVVKLNFPKYKTVFVGPCPAKVVEATHYEDVDAALTFTEFDKLVEVNKEKRIVEENQANLTFDDFYSYRNKIYPKSGGLTKIMVEKDILNKEECVSRDGVLSIHELFENKNDHDGIVFYDTLFCDGGCLGGPCVKTKLTEEQCNEKVEEYRIKSKLTDYKRMTSKEGQSLNNDIDFTPCFSKK